MGRLIQSNGESVEVTGGADLNLDISEVGTGNLGRVRPLSILWPDFAGRLLKTKRTEETAAEYGAMSKADRGKIKNVGGYVGSAFEGSARKKANVRNSQVISLDYDGGASLQDVWGFLCMLEYAGVVYTTHSHTLGHDRFRVVLPLLRPVSPDEYTAIVREVAARIGEEVDKASEEPERVMYWPSTPSDGEFISRYSGGRVLDPDEILRDTCASTAQTKDHPREPEDPGQKKGLIGAFCRAYSISEAIDAFLSDKYERCEGRGDGYYTYLPGSTPGGMFVYPSGLHAYSHHATDPANTGHAVNAFDLVRLHKYGDLDAGKAESGTPLSERPSFKAMRKLSHTDEAVQNEIRKEQAEKAAADYDDVADNTASAGIPDILYKLLEQIAWVDFRKVTEIDADKRIPHKVYIYTAIEQLNKVAVSNNWGLCTQNGFIYAYTGTYWKEIDAEAFKHFLARAALKMGVPKSEARPFQSMDELYKQFLSDSYLSAPEPDGRVLVNLANGTLEVSLSGAELREHRREDFMRYQLPFGYNQDAGCPMFDKFLHRVLPDEGCRDVLAEYLGYVFTRGLKLEKALMLYGSGANGKSVVFDIVQALLGPENICSYPLSDITRQESWQRAELSNKLLNYNSEISGDMGNAIFKQLVSGEPVNAQRKYKDPFMMRDYAKLMFNGNVLPKAVELTDAYFRRFLIMPFNVTIPENEQDPELAKKIIRSELGGILNWVLAGLHRLLKNKKFTHSNIIATQVAAFKKESDSVAMFVEDEGYTPDVNGSIPLKEIYDDYRSYCMDSGYRAVSNRNAAGRLRALGFQIERKNVGTTVYAKKK